MELDAVVVAWLAFRVTNGLRYELDTPVATVGGLSRWIVARGPSFITTEPGKWPREQIAARVREIVVDQLGCEKEYREDARFNENLNLGQGGEGALFLLHSGASREYLFADEHSGASRGN